MENKNKKQKSWKDYQKSFYKKLKRAKKRADDIVMTILVIMGIILTGLVYWDMAHYREYYMLENDISGGLRTVRPVKEAKAYPEASQTAKTDITASIASWYDYELNGIKWSKNHLTCASRTLKRYSKAKVTNLSNGKSVICYVNDYIEHPERQIDLSSYAFSQLADLKIGLIKVKIEQL